MQRRKKKQKNRKHKNYSSFFNMHILLKLLDLAFSYISHTTSFFPEGEPWGEGVGGQFSKKLAILKTNQILQANKHFIKVPERNKKIRNLTFFGHTLNRAYFERFRKLALESKFFVNIIKQNRFLCY